MKKITVKITVLAFVLFLSSTAFAFQTNEPRPQTKTRGITYVVSVLPSATTQICGSYFVSMTDGQGNLIATPQLYEDDKTTYVFRESGPVFGARIATLEKVGGPQNICSIKIVTKPDQQFGHFFPQHTYEFSLKPMIIPGDD